jgi:hypothetical protein
VCVGVVAVEDFVCVGPLYVDVVRLSFPSSSLSVPRRLDFTKQKNRRTLKKK